MTRSRVELKFILPEFADSRNITWSFYEAKNKACLNGYDCIIGQDLLKGIGMDLDFKSGHMTWDDVKVPMKDYALVQKNLTRELNAFFF